MSMRPEDILTPTPAGVCCQTRLLSYRSDAAGRTGADHACAFRSCARRPRRGAGDAGDPRPDATALRREFRRHDAGDRATAKASISAGAKVTFHPAGHVLGSAQIAVEAGGLRIVASGDYKNVARSDLRAVRTGAVRRLRHRGDVRPAGVPPRRSPRARSRNCCLRRAVSRSARISSAPIRSARRNA